MHRRRIGRGWPTSVALISIAILAVGAFAPMADAQGTGIGIVGVGVGGPGAGRVMVTSDAIVRKAPECAPLFKGGGSAGRSTSTGGATVNIWEAAKAPALQQHCERLSTSVELLREGRFAATIEQARAADALTPGQAGPWVVRGEALGRWGKLDEAVVAFEKAKAIEPRSLDDAETLDDYGAVLLRLGRIADARVVFRSLLPRVGGASGLCGVGAQCDAAGLAYLSAGVLAFDGGAASLDDAVAMLREARLRSEPTRDVRRVAGTLLALALDRRGDVADARDLDAEIVGTRGVPTDLAAEVTARLPWPEELIAARALALEALDPIAAADAWKRYLSSGGDKRGWAAHAHAHLDRLEKSQPAAKKPR